MCTVTQVTTHIQPVKTQQKPLTYVCSVYILKKQIWAVLCLCVEWIIIAYLTGSHWPILFCLKLQNNTQAHLRVLWALDEFCFWHGVIGTRIWLPSNDNICQSSLVSNLYCLLHSAASTFFFL